MFIQRVKVIINDVTWQAIYDLLLEIMHHLQDTVTCLAFMYVTICVLEQWTTTDKTRRQLSLKSRLQTGWLSDRLNNLFDNRLYHVNGVLDGGPSISNC